MANITKLVIDSEEVKDLTKVIESNEDVQVAKSELELGDKVTLIYDEQESDYNEAIFLSVDNENVYKNLALEAEIEFVKQVESYENNFELIVRAVSNKDKTYTVDEYYAFQGEFPESKFNKEVQDMFNTAQDYLKN